MATIPTADTLMPPVENDSRMQGLQNKLRGLGTTLEGVSAEEQKKVRAELHEAAAGFEAMLLNQLLKDMMPEGESMFGNGLGSKTYHQLFVSELSQMMAETGQIGLAQQIERDVAARVGLTEESQSGTEPIPGTVLGHPLPHSSRSQTGPIRNISSEKTNHGMMASALRSYGGQWQKPAFISPVEGRLSSEFGERKDPFTGEHRHHQGIDIAAPEGTGVNASAYGTVTYSGSLPGYGKTIIVEHAGGYETRYAHNSDLMVREGEVVEAGQQVAKVGSTGRSTGPHLHFEVRHQGQPCNPQELIECTD